MMIIIRSGNVNGQCKIVNKSLAFALYAKHTLTWPVHIASRSHNGNVFTNEISESAPVALFTLCFP